MIKTNTKVLWTKVAVGAHFGWVEGRPESDNLSKTVRCVVADVSRPQWLSSLKANPAESAEFHPSITPKYSIDSTAPFPQGSRGSVRVERLDARGNS